MKDFTIYYSNGYFETMDKINFTLLHMIDIGLIKVIFSNKEKLAYVSDGEGNFKKVKIPEISGL